MEEEEGGGVAVAVLQTCTKERIEEAVQHEAHHRLAYFFCYLLRGLTCIEEWSCGWIRWSCRWSVKAGVLVFR